MPAKSIVDVGPCECRWPVEGEDEDGQALFCAETSRIGRSYCGFHNALAFPLSVKRRKRRRNVQNTTAMSLRREWA